MNKSNRRLLLRYLLYIFFRFIFNFIQTQIIWRINGIYNHLTKITDDFDIISSPIDTCQLLSIISRKKLIEGDITSEDNFIWWHDKFVDPTKLLLSDPTWTLYTIDKKFVYFVKMPKPWPRYHAREAPFVHMRQFVDATKLARMSLKAFCHFADQSLTNPKGPVVYYSIAARSGSTLLARAMQVSEEKILCFSEPIVFTKLSFLQQRNFINEILLIELLRSVFKYFCKEQRIGQTYLIKVQSHATRIVPYIKQAMPQIKHMYTFRRNTRQTLSSFEKMLRAVCAGDLHVFFYNFWSPLVMEYNASFECEMYIKFGLKDVLDVAIVYHVASWYYYQKNKDIFDIPLIYYEDLIADKKKTLRSVFQLCEIPYDEFIEVALQEFQNDSQEGTAWSQNKLKSIQDTILDEVKISKMNYMCDQLKIPRIDIF